MVKNDTAGTETFVAKVTKTRNKKGTDYFIYRLNVPNRVAEQLKMSENDYLVLAAKKAEWYHLIDWSEATNTWVKLPTEIKDKIIEDGLYKPEESGLLMPIIFQTYAKTYDLRAKLIYESNFQGMYQSAQDLKAATTVEGTLQLRPGQPSEQSLGVQTPLATATWDSDKLQWILNRA